MIVYGDYLVALSLAMHYYKTNLTVNISRIRYGSNRNRIIFYNRRIDFIFIFINEILSDSGRTFFIDNSLKISSTSVFIGKKQSRSSFKNVCSYFPGTDH